MGMAHSMRVAERGMEDKGKRNNKQQKGTTLFEVAARGMPWMGRLLRWAN
jgi:hypothetical protein